MIKLNNIKDLIKDLGIADNEENIKWAYKMLLIEWKIQSKIDHGKQMLAIENEYLLAATEEDCCECGDDCQCHNSSECCDKECSK